MRKDPRERPDSVRDCRRIRPELVDYSLKPFSNLGDYLMILAMVFSLSVIAGAVTRAIFF